MAKAIDTLIINSPYKEPSQHWKYIRETQEFELTEGRRASVKFDPALVGVPRKDWPKAENGEEI